MTTDHSPSLDEIREAAEKATPGPWSTGGSWHYIDGAEFPCVYPTAYPEREVTIAICGDTLDEAQNAADATYIAMMDPQTTLGMIEALEESHAQARWYYESRQEARALVRVLGEALEIAQEMRHRASQGTMTHEAWRRNKKIEPALAAYRAFTEANPTPGAEA